MLFKEKSTDEILGKISGLVEELQRRATSLVSKTAEKNSEVTRLIEEANTVRKSIVEIDSELAKNAIAIENFRVLAGGARIAVDVSRSGIAA